MNDRKPNQFVDTNVLVYAHDSSAALKHENAQELLTNLWESRQGCLSIQVLQEFYVTITRKVARPLSTEQASRIIENLSVWRIHSPTANDFQNAILIQTQYDISFWDAMILQSANSLDCDTLWSEHLNTGQLYGDVRAANPFIVQ